MGPKPEGDQKTSGHPKRFKSWNLIEVCYADGQWALGEMKSTRSKYKFAAN